MCGMIDNGVEHALHETLAPAVTAPDDTGKVLEVIPIGAERDLLVGIGDA
jgi:hypothetical protein